MGLNFGSDKSQGHDHSGKRRSRILLCSLRHVSSILLSSLSFLDMHRGDNFSLLNSQLDRMHDAEPAVG